jgi:hypothetical protein
MSLGRAVGTMRGLLHVFILNLNFSLTIWYCVAHRVFSLCRLDSGLVRLARRTHYFSSPVFRTSGSQVRCLNEVGFGN